MGGATTLFSTPTHFPIASKDFLSQPYTHTPVPTTRKRKPIVTYQSPGSGVVDLGLLVRNTALEFKVAAATAAAARSIVPRATTPSPPTGVPPPSEGAASDNTNPATQLTPHTTRMVPLVYRLAAIPRPPRPLYHPLSRPGASKPLLKSNTSTTSVGSHLAVPSAESGRRSSSRTRRPAPKVRDTEGLATGLPKTAQDRPSPAKRRRGANAGKRKRGLAQQQEPDGGDSTYAATKRSRKPREKEKMEVEVEPENEEMPLPLPTTMTTTSEVSPQTGYSTRAKRSRKAAHGRAESSTSDGTGSVTRTTPVNGHVEEFWVPTKTT